MGGDIHNHIQSYKICLLTTAPVLALENQKIPEHSDTLESYNLFMVSSLQISDVTEVGKGRFFCCSGAKAKIDIATYVDIPRWPAKIKKPFAFVTGPRPPSSKVVVRVAW